MAVRVLKMEQVPGTRTTHILHLVVAVAVADVRPLLQTLVQVVGLQLEQPISGIPERLAELALAQPLAEEALAAVHAAAKALPCTAAMAVVVAGGEHPDQTANLGRGFKWLAVAVAAMQCPETVT